MTTKPIAEMTMEELEEVVERIVDKKMKGRRSKDPRSVKEILESIDRNLWTPPPGAKSNLELLREDRDR